MAFHDSPFQRYAVAVAPFAGVETVPEISMPVVKLMSIPEVTSPALTSTRVASEDDAAPS